MTERQSAIFSCHPQTLIRVSLLHYDTIFTHNKLYNAHAHIEKLKTRNVTSQCHRGGRMKIAIIGSTGYRSKMRHLRDQLVEQRHAVGLATEDSYTDRELTILSDNRGLIEWADEVRVFWDQRSVGTVFDFGMVFALRKPLVVEYLEPKTIAQGMEAYAKESNQ